MRYDLHTHSLLSDGELLPSELARRYEANGFEAVAITDHADFSNLEFLCDSIAKFCRMWPKGRIKVLPGIELTHLPLEQFKPAAAFARKKGMRVIVAHGETLVEPVYPGTARAALEADIDILSHPGSIREEDVIFAARRGVLLEITARNGHNLGNEHVVILARKHGAKLCLNTDAHTPSDIPTPDLLDKVGLAAGLTPQELIVLDKGVRSHFAL
jgi:putative hydrolase